MTAREVANVTTVTEMKSILFKKLQDEQTYFKKSDIHIVGFEGGFNIWVNDYENEAFEMYFSYDEDLGFIVCVSHLDPDYPDDATCVAYVDSKTALDIKTALIEIGYYIGTRF